MPEGYREPLLNRLLFFRDLSWSDQRPAGVAKAVLLAYLAFAAGHSVVRLILVFGPADVMAGLPILRLLGLQQGDFMIPGFLAAVYLVTGKAKFILGSIGLMTLKVVLYSVLATSLATFETSHLLPSLSVVSISGFWALALWIWVVPGRLNTASSPANFH